MKPLKIIICLSLFLCFSTIYFFRIHFAEDVSMTFKGITKEEFKTIELYATSPLNRKLFFYKEESILNFNSLGNSTFINKIFLYIPDTILNSIEKIDLIIGDNQIVIEKVGFLDFFLSDSQNGLYYFNPQKHKSSVYAIIKAFNTWPENLKKTIKLVLYIIFVLSIIIFLIKKKLHISLGLFLIKKTGEIHLYLNKRIPENTFFKITAIATFVLMSVFALIMHFSVFCNFSAFIFLLMLYGMCILLTFLLGFLIKKLPAYNIRLSLTSLFVILIIAEFFLRYYKVNASYLEKNGLCYEKVFQKRRDSRYYTRRPNIPVEYNTPEFNYYRKVYPEGFIQPMPSKDKKKNEYRVLALGDSFTEGLGVCNDSTWVVQLEELLQESNPDKMIYTFNAGSASSDPIFQYVLLTELFKDYHFDMVIVATNESDILDISLRGGFDRFKPDGTVFYKNVTNWEWLYGVSYIFRLIVINGLDYDHTLIKNAELQQKRIKALVEIYYTHLLFYNYAKIHGIELLHVFHPMPQEVISPEIYNLGVLSRFFMNHKSDAHIIDLQEYFSKDLNISLINIYDYYWKNDRHHNSKGYRAFAEGIFKYIKDRELIK